MKKIVFNMKYIWDKMTSLMFAPMVLFSTLMCCQYLQLRASHALSGPSSCVFALVWLYNQALFCSRAQHTHTNMNLQWDSFLSDMINYCVRKWGWGQKMNSDLPAACVMLAVFLFRWTVI